MPVESFPVARMVLYDRVTVQKIDNNEADDQVILDQRGNDILDQDGRQILADDKP